MVRTYLAAFFFCLLPAAESIVNIADPLYTSRADHIQRTKLFGNINAFAYYFAELLVGTPPQRVSVIIDTGSGLCAFPCVGCSHCGKHLDLPFDRNASNTSQVLPCGIGWCLMHFDQKVDPSACRNESNRHRGKRKDHYLYQ